MQEHEDILESFADQLGVEPEVVEERWAGRPDRLAEDIFRVRDMDTGEIRDLGLFETQRKAIMAFFYGDADTINNYKGRRIGYSFVYCVAFLLQGMLVPNSFYPVVSRKYEQAENRIEDIENLIKNAKVKIPTNFVNKGEIELWNGSGFKAYSGDPDASRGDKSARAVLLDEMAFIEDQKKVKRAFGAFLSLGKGRKMVQVSTPNVKNDLFMQTHNRGSETGYVDSDGNAVPPDYPNARRVGVISIRQPSFYNADEIDINKPLYEQDVQPVRPDMNIEMIEDERAADPLGFGQEYLCRPIVDEYRFFSEEAIADAMERGAEVVTGMMAPKGSFRVIGVDIGISKDDTVIQVFDHEGDRRIHRYMEVVTDDVLGAHGFASPDRGNARQVATRIAYIFREMDADLVVLDKTGPGETFDRQITEKLGRAVLGFNFSDKRRVEEMMGDFNNALRNGKVTLIPHDRFQDELESIVKIKKEDWSVPKFSGKDNSETGKDDTAMAAVLAAFPPGYTVQPGRQADQRSASDSHTELWGTPHQPAQPVQSPSQDVAREAAQTGFGAATISRSSGGYGSRRSYSARYRR
ncbi:terminase large subunit domain-containing protein [Haloferax larsenii]|uniref:Terminase-like family protein n=1 Tax=Haloferax larsenii TaxID=302484 RepID=A0A1H7N3N9_HALLR|nr:terminase large subunit [Haloferax larsenii]SEL18110.1 Terminase-like family protein [Haloferax larsenii]